MFDGALIALVTVGYLAIVQEHRLGINKAATALFAAVLCWVLNFMKVFPQDNVMIGQLNVHLADISQVVFFLIGAMAVVELIDAFHGFTIITNFIRTKDRRLLLWVTSGITFFISSFLANMTVAIVMISLLRRLVPDRQERMIFVAMVVVASNAGGAWTPIGDTTTMMLWIGGQVSAGSIVQKVFLPSLVSVLIPLMYCSSRVKKGPVIGSEENKKVSIIAGGRQVFFLGVGTMIVVPFLTTFTNIPPYMGMFLSLSIMWALTDLIHQERHFLKVPHILGKIDMSSIFFFIGILLMISALETAGILHNLALGMDHYLKSKSLIACFMGIFSSVIDNVPLTAAMMGMYSLKTYLINAKLWHMTAYCAGTGGSILIIGSAPGVIAMGMERINFTWYLKTVSLSVLVGYLVGFLFIR